MKLENGTKVEYNNKIYFVIYEDTKNGNLRLGEQYPMKGGLAIVAHKNLINLL